MVVSRSPKLPIVIPCECGKLAGHVAGTDFAFMCDGGHVFQKIPKLVPRGRRVFGYVLLDPEGANLIPPRHAEGDRVYQTVRGSDVEVGRLIA